MRKLKRLLAFNCRFACLSIQLGLDAYPCNLLAIVFAICLKYPKKVTQTAGSLGTQTPPPLRLCICLLHIVRNKEFFPTSSGRPLPFFVSLVLCFACSALLLYNYCFPRCWYCCLATKHCCVLLLHIIKCYSTAYKTCQSSSPGHAYAQSSLRACGCVCSLCFWHIGHIVYNCVCGFINHAAAIIIMVSNWIAI